MALGSENVLLDPITIAKLTVPNKGISLTHGIL